MDSPIKKKSNIVGITITEYKKRTKINNENNFQKYFKPPYNRSGVVVFGLLHRPQK